ncbi:MAG: 2,3-bisphosphoglycerate-independent phosphoglycerate mutase [Coriobacteriaceae bacterium]|nr:2,3-bisphosphoglycerate-independent phosphoglycerate mutase [Coriobacteriaceae bacterium]
MQYALVILDGASGDAVPEFGGRTSLEESATPNLDALAQAGMVGLMQNVPPHMVSGSDVACLSIMGFDPALYQVGRGAIEGAALDIDLAPGQVAFRMNLSSVADGILKSYSTDNLPTADGHALALELKSALDDEAFTLYPGISFRQVLVMERGTHALGLAYGLPHDNAGLDVSEAFKPKAPPGDTAAQQVADLLVGYMCAANEVLAKSPVNARRLCEGRLPANQAWVFWPGMRPGAMRSFQESYRKTVALNSAVDLLVGLARMTGMRVYRFEGVTDGPTNDFAAQAAGAITMLEDGNEVVIVHVEAPDAAGHDGCSAEKKRAIEESDRHVLGALREYAKTHPLRIAVMPDHPTPLSTRKHSHEPVPFVVAGPGIAHNGARRMTEAQAARTGVLIDPGHAFMGDVFLSGS